MCLNTKAPPPLQAGPALEAMPEGTTRARIPPEASALPGSGLPFDLFVCLFVF